MLPAKEPAVAQHTDSIGADFRGEAPLSTALGLKLLNMWVFDILLLDRRLSMFSQIGLLIAGSIAIP